MLVVIVGPIASGKSTVAAALGSQLRASGRRVAILDLDDVVETIGGFVNLEPDHFLRAHLVFGRLVRSWLDQGFDVIAHGPFIDGDEDAAVLHDLPVQVRPRRVLLLATFAVALERVMADPDRMLSRYPDVLRATYDRFEAVRPSMEPSEWTFDTTTLDAEEIVEQLTDSLSAK